MAIRQQFQEHTHISSTATNILSADIVLKFLRNWYHYFQRLPSNFRSYFIMPKHNTVYLNSRKPFKVLVHFDAKRQAQFLSYLDSIPKRKRNQSLEKAQELLEVAFKLHIDQRPVSKAEILAHAQLPQEANNFDKIVSFLYDKLQEFLAWEELQASPVALQQLACQAYRKMPLEWKEIQRRHAEAQRILARRPQSCRLSMTQLALDMDLGSQATSRMIPQKNRGYEALLTTLESNYILQRLRLSCAIANNQAVATLQAHPDTLLQLPESLPFSQYPPLAQMYYFAYQIITGQETPRSIATLNQLLDAQEVTAPTFPHADMLDIYGYLLNAYVRKVNAGDRSALGHLSALHDHLLHNGILLDQGRISKEHFKNVISAKLKNQQVRAARAVFEQFSDKIDGDSHANARRYNHALILYAEEHLQQAAQELENLTAQTSNLQLDHYYGLDIRIYLLKIYFDQLAATTCPPQTWDLTDEKMRRLLEAFKGYIQRKKIAAIRKTKYENFRLLMQAMYAHTFGSTSFQKSKEVQKLKRMIEKKETNLNQQWFFDRLRP